ncbi:cytochrome P450 monooxygenase GliC2 [Penicillium manginii]|uniref:cytochrome P450 monooxygenase GliC2 n=1 Tax=Penicillium manginii TaxID=203109 RepID=UPI002547A6D8|nr:cytochrome P450 monooxygenase GliC2 [Penicillium manginii]KAJ5750795.1 cytochrome P450 monooxygenase GliC2 [Penicillium manginii]
MGSKFDDLWAAGLIPAHLKTAPITNYIAPFGDLNFLLATSTIGLAIVAFFIIQSPAAFLHYTNIIRSIDNKGLLDGPKFSYPFGNSKERLFQSRKYSFEWAHQYGKIYRIWTGLHAEVVITTPEDVAKFYQDANSHNKTFHRRSGWVTNSVLGEAVGFVSGDRWRVFQKILDPLVSNSVAVKHIPRINQAGSEFVASIPNVRIDKGGANDPLIISAARTFMPFPLLETSRVFFGEMEDTEKAELLEIGGIYSKALLLLFENGPFRRWLGYWMHTPTEYKATKEFLNRWDSFNDKIAQARQNRNDLPITQLWKHVHQGTITQKELIQTITEMTYTNLDVTSHVITTTCLFLADNRATQDALLAEIDLHRNDIEKYLGRKDTLLHYAFLEAMRLQPVLPFTLPEASITDKELGGYHIPKHCDYRLLWA